MKNNQTYPCSDCLAEPETDHQESCVEIQIEKDRQDEQDRQEIEPEETEKWACCFDPWCGCRYASVPKKQIPGFFGTIGDLIRDSLSNPKKQKRKS